MIIVTNNCYLFIYYVKSIKADTKKHLDLLQDMLGSGGELLLAGGAARSPHLRLLHLKPSLRPLPGRGGPPADVSVQCVEGDSSAHNQ